VKLRYGTGARPSWVLLGVAPIMTLLRSSTSATDLSLVVRVNLHFCGQDEPSHWAEGRDDGVKPRIGGWKYFHQPHITSSLNILTSGTDRRDALGTRFECIEAAVQRWDA